MIKRHSKKSSTGLVDKVLRFVENIAKAAGYGQARIDVCYSNLSPEELTAITNILPIGKMSAVKEVTLRNFKTEGLKIETLPSYIDGAVIHALSTNPKPSLFAEEWLFDYDSSSGMPRVTVKPANSPLPTDETRLAGLRRELSRVVYALFEDHQARGLVPRLEAYLAFLKLVMAQHLSA